MSLFAAHFLKISLYWQKLLTVSAPIIGFAAMTSVIADDVSTPAPISLMSSSQDNLGWNFDNGQEFPGATGSLVVDPDPDSKCDGHDALKLTGDFTQGGAYVQAGCHLPAFDNEKYELSLWVKSRDNEEITLRIGDAMDQCHQIKINIPHGLSWHHVIVPLGSFYDDLNHERDFTVSNISAYKHWGGPNDGKWHGPAQYLAIILGPLPDYKRVTLELSNISVIPKVSTTSTASNPAWIQPQN